MLCCFGRPRRKFVASNSNLQEENWIPTIPIDVKDDGNDQSIHAITEVSNTSNGNEPEVSVISDKEGKKICLQIGFLRVCTFEPMLRIFEQHFSAVDSNTQ